MFVFCFLGSQRSWPKDPWHWGEEIRYGNEIWCCYGLPDAKKKPVVVVVAVVVVVVVVVVVGCLWELLLGWFLTTRLVGCFTNVWFIDLRRWMCVALFSETISRKRDVVDGLRRLWSTLFVVHLFRVCSLRSNWVSLVFVVCFFFASGRHFFWFIFGLSLVGDWWIDDGVFAFLFFFSLVRSLRNVFLPSFDEMNCLFFIKDLFCWIGLQGNSFHGICHFLFCCHCGSCSGFLPIFFLNSFIYLPSFSGWFPRVCHTFCYLKKKIIFAHFCLYILCHFNVFVSRCFVELLQPVRFTWRSYRVLPSFFSGLSSYFLSFNPNFVADQTAACCWGHFLFHFF